jgi:DNA-binding FadR family transcriptional regulator
MTMESSEVASQDAVNQDTVNEGASLNLGRKPLFQEIQRRIRHYIFERGLKPGEMLPSAAEMASYLGVSAASLREGLRAMEALGMLETRHGVGTFVCSYNLLPIFETLSFSLLFDNEGLLKLMQIREAMEVGLIPEVVAQISDDDVRKLEVLCQQTTTPTWGSAEDIEFHRIMYRCLGNELIAQILDIYWMTSVKLIDRSAYSPTDRQLNRQVHCEIAAALQQRNAHLAVERTRKHFADAKQRLSRNEASIEAQSN